MPQLTLRRPSIGVVQLRGVISGGPKLSSTVDLMQSVGDDPTIRAVLLDIDSPGGSASASDALRLAVARVRDRKPVLAYVRSLGASGAYMVCCAATRVMALPTGLVGSIGVIAVQPHLTQLLERAGIQVSVAKAGHLKDHGAFWREQTEDEREVEQALVDEYYEHFVSMVALARHLDRARTLELATGEVFTGRRAMEMHLVDEVGDWTDAVELAMRMGDVPVPRLVHRQPRRSLAERLMMGRAGAGMGLRSLFSSRVLYMDVRSLGEYV